MEEDVTTKLGEDTIVRTEHFLLAGVALILIKEVEVVLIFIKEAGVEPLIRTKVGEIGQRIPQISSFMIAMALLFSTLNHRTAFLHLTNLFIHPQTFNQFV